MITYIRRVSLKGIFMNLLKDLIHAYKINKRMKNYKYIHIMFNDKFNKPFVDFLNRQFNNNEHLILCKRFFDNYPFPEGENVIEIKSLKYLNFKSAKKIICHSLFDDELVDFLYKHQNLLKTQAYWLIWGGDLYKAPDDKINNYVRKNIKGYIAAIQGDEICAQKKYKNPNTELFSAAIPCAITLEHLKNAQITPPPRQSVKILINNSCDSTTLEMMDILSVFREKNIKISTILSYGALKYKDEIIKKGKELFGKNFEYLEKFLGPQEYVDFLAQHNILILNQNRQQGCGNISNALYLGIKIFIKKELVHYSYFQNEGCSIFDTNTIKNLSFEEFIAMPDELKTKNKNVITDHYNENIKTQAWKKVFGENNA